MLNKIQDFLDEYYVSVSTYTGIKYKLLNEILIFNTNYEEYTFELFLESEPNICFNNKNKDENELYFELAEFLECVYIHITKQYNKNIDLVNEEISKLEDIKTNLELAKKECEIDSDEIHDKLLELGNN